MTVDQSKMTRLPSGLRVVTETMPRLETAAIGVWVDVGSRHEQPEVNGVAHMLEHMAFKGTKRRSAKEIAEQVEDVGGSLNAYTSREHTAYYARLLADDVPLAADVLSDILQNSVFDEGELEKERHVILQEIGEVDDTPSDLVFDLFQETAYPDQAIGRSILGSSEIVEGMPRQALFDYVRGNYCPSRMIVSAAGKVNHDDIVETAEKLFDHLPANNTVDPEMARYRGGVHFIPRELEQVHVCTGVEAFAYDDPDFYALQVFSAALGGGMSSRLFQRVREDLGLCYSVFSFTSLHADSGLLGIYAATGAEEIEPLMGAMGHELATVGHDMSTVELHRAKVQMKAGLLMSLEGCFSTCEDMARQHLCYGQRLSAAEISAKIDEVDLGSIKRVSDRLLHQPQITLSAIGPAKGEPSLEQFAGALGR